MAASKYSQTPTQCTTLCEKSVFIAFDVKISFVIITQCYILRYIIKHNWYLIENQNSWEK